MNNNAAHIAANNQARAEDLTWLAEAGESTEGAAYRLGILRDSLEKWCQRNNPDIWQQLLANEIAETRVRQGAIRGWRAP